MVFVLQLNVKTEHKGPNILFVSALLNNTSFSHILLLVALHCLNMHIKSDGGLVRCRKKSPLAKSNILLFTSVLGDLWL